MWKPGRMAGIVVAAVLLSSGVSMAQEGGAMYQFFKGVMAIPKAIIGSFRGPRKPSPAVEVCAINGMDPGQTLLATQPYLAVAPTAVIEQQPEYVTYNAVITVNGAAQPAPNGYVYGPVPFDAP